VRPFREFVGGDRAVEMSGRIERDRFIVSLLGREIELEARIADAEGPRAFVEEQERVLPGDVTVRIRPDYDEDMPPGGELSVFFGAEAPPPPHSAEVNRIVPDLRPSYTIYFDGSGRVNGNGSSSGAAKPRRGGGK
jgi:hypothetical protein